MMRRLVAFGLILLPMFGPMYGEDTAKRPVDSVHTETVKFAPGGTIRVVHSFGSLYVEGWDRPEVEVTVDKSQQPASALDRIHVVTERRSDGELVISTTAPHKHFPYLWGGTGGVAVECQIRVPRDSKLAIQHGTGSVLVSGVTGEIQATSRAGDIVLLLPESGTYSIDARSKLGTVYSDFAGDFHRRYLVGSGFVHANASPSHRLYLRTGIGGISIKSIPAAAGGGGE